MTVFQLSYQERGWLERCGAWLAPDRRQKLLQIEVDFHRDRID